MSNGKSFASNRPSEQRRPGSDDRTGAEPGSRGGGYRSLEQILRSQETVKYFTDPHRTSIRPDLLDREAEDIARKLQDIPASQLRRFFGTVMGIRRRIQVDSEFASNAEAIRAELAFLKASAAYTAKRLNYTQAAKRKGDPLELVAMFTRHRNSVRDAKDFEAFARHFEAVIAFHKVYAPERSGGAP